MTELKITHADRSRAAFLHEALRPNTPRKWLQDMREGRLDGDRVLVALARHRIAAEEGKAELVEALERIEGATMSMYSKPADMVQDIKRMAATALARVRGEG